MSDDIRSMIVLLNSQLPAAAPPAAPAATPTLHQQQIAHAKQCFDEKATFDAAVAAAVEQVIAAHDAAASPPLRAASYSSAAAPRAPAGFRVPAPPPPPPPTPPGFSYVHSLSTDRLVPVKSATLSMVKCFKIDLVPAGMNTQALAITSFMDGQRLPWCCCAPCCARHDPASQSRLMHCRQKAQREIYPWKVATTRDKGTGGATAPKDRGGKHHKGGNSPRGNPTRQQQQYQLTLAGMFNIYILIFLHFIRTLTSFSTLL